MTPFDFTVEGVPISAQNKKPGAVEGWRADVRAAARAAQRTPAPISDDQIGVTIVYFHAGPAHIDIDNIIKPILDALKKGMVYWDDRQVSQVVARRTSLSPGLTIRNPSRTLAAAIDAGRDFVYVGIGPGPDHGMIPV